MELWERFHLIPSPPGKRECERDQHDWGDPLNQGERSQAMCRECRAWGEVVGSDAATFNWKLAGRHRSTVAS